MEDQLEQLEPLEKKEDNNQDLLPAALEAILFTYGEPLSIKRLTKILKKTPDQIKEAISKLETKYQKEDSGLILFFSNEKIQLATKQKFSNFLKNLVKEEFKENLSQAALETLALIVYFSPISKAKIDYFRGVNSAFILRSLMLRGLIERQEYKNSYVYSPSFDLLRHLGIQRKEDLKNFSYFQEKFQELKNYFEVEKN